MEVATHPPPHKEVQYYTREEAEALLARASLTDIRSTWVNQNSWSVIGRKPTSS